MYRGSLFLTALFLSTTACASGSSATHKPTSLPSSGNQSVSASQCPTLKARAPEIEACPPPDLKLDHPVVSRDPALADADAQHAVDGFARSYAIYNWAINHGYENFIHS